ncbi:Eisosome component PIL1-domain-containing protein [Lentinula aciculospora]|uniref:Eisosome component PIL1-domain-containing protein n=1 Tax=Lentinula aciculospora TaxID=153920 RepID=A0A9W9AP33_9AGAR|nr:Eisosome component PIL1-domain-containing protein [Lentinula aciculospora]
MPVPGFISSFADKAQSAIADHIPGSHKPSSPDPSAQPSANTAAAQGYSGGVGHKNPTLEAIQHQLRSLGQQYGTGATPVQKIITTAKGVAIDLDSLSRDQKAQSKELYTWGQGEEADLKDVTDRLAYLNFVSGSIASSLAVKLDAARSPLKLLRDAENALAPRRNLRATLHQQLARLEHDNQKGMEKKIFELKEQIRKAEADDLPQEKEIELLKRKGVRESEQLKWEAIREYGEKLVLLSQAAYPVITALPTLPPSPESPYTGAQATGAARASLQRALDNYKTGHINLPPHSAGSDLSRSDTRSFGESHASELSSISSETTQSNIPVTPPPTGVKVLPAAAPLRKLSIDSTSLNKAQSPPPINPSALNLSPAPLPVSSHSNNSNATPSSTSSMPITSPDALKPISLPTISDTPTIAETGVPVLASESGPGPASGSLRDVKAASPTAGPRSGGFPSGDAPPTSFGAMGAPATSNENKWESAEEEKKRLAVEYSQVHQGKSAPAPQYESAEDEKKRIEREEREKLLKSGGQGPTESGGAGSSKKEDDDELPPYQDV